MFYIFIFNNSIYLRSKEVSCHIEVLNRVVNNQIFKEFSACLVIEAVELQAKLAQRFIELKSLGKISGSVLSDLVVRKIQE